MLRMEIKAIQYVNLSPKQLLLTPSCAFQQTLPNVLYLICFAVFIRTNICFLYRKGGTWDFYVKLDDVVFWSYLLKEA